MTTVRAQPQDKTSIVPEGNHTCSGQTDACRVGKDHCGVVGVVIQVQDLIAQLTPEIRLQS